MRHTNHRGARAAVALLTIAALTLTACAKDKTDSDSPSGNDDASSAQDAAKAAVEEGYKGTSELPDATSRPGVKDKSVIFISSGQNSLSSSIPLSGQVEAAKALGWKTQILDGQSNPSLWPGLVRQAIAAKPDAISLQSIDCPLISAPLKEARVAGIKIAASYSFDCDDPKFGGEAMFDAVPFYARAKGDIGEFTRSYAQLQGEAVIAKFGSEANVLQLNDEEFRILDYTSEGFQRAIKAGSGTITYAKFTVSQLGPNLESLVAGELLKNPDINVVKSPFTGATLLGIASGIKKANRTGKVYVVGGEGFSPELDLMRAGAVDVAVVNPPLWVGWATIDSLNSIFRGEKPVDNGVGWTMVDSKHGMPEKDGQEFTDFPDYRAVYTKAWGV